MINRKPSSLPFDHAIPAIPKVNEPAISDTILSEYVTRCISIRFALVIGGRSIIRSDKCGRPGPESDAIGRSSFSTVCSVTEKKVVIKPAASDVDYCSVTGPASCNHSTESQWDAGSK